MTPPPPTPHAAHPSRLFLALWPGREARQTLHAWQSRWVWPAGAQVVAPARLHLTLHFLGDLPSQHVPDLARSLQVPFERFEIQFGRVAVWPDGMAVIEPDAVPPGLLALHDKLGEVLQRQGRPLDARAYRPHVTWARRARAATGPAEGIAIRWRVQGYALVQSTPGHGYANVATYRAGSGVSWLRR